LNACRMHLRVSRLSDIASAQGTRHRSDVLKGLDSAIHLSEALWPRQASPMQYTAKKRERCKIILRDKTTSPPCRAVPSSFSEYVAPQPNHVRRLFRNCDLSESATQKLVSLICSSGTFSGGTDGGLLNELGTFGFVWGGY
jgi:hypothetical protein